MSETRIEAGDIVFHRPSGEEWVVLGVKENRNELVWMGWPKGYAKLSDCELIEKGRGINESERKSREQMYGIGWDDELEAMENGESVE